MTDLSTGTPAGGSAYLGRGRVVPMKKLLAKVRKARGIRLRRPRQDAAARRPAES
jgi:hypothetical protein